MPTARWNPTCGIVNPRPGVARTGKARSFVAFYRAASAPVEGGCHLGERGVPRLARTAERPCSLMPYTGYQQSGPMSKRAALTAAFRFRACGHIGIWW